jgi:hypothetical protein
MTVDYEPFTIVIYESVTGQNKDPLGGQSEERRNVSITLRWVVAKRTQTSNFGTSERVSHDSTPFYSRKLYKDINMPKLSPKDLVENEVPREFLDKIILGDAREVLKKLPDSCAHLMITSPPCKLVDELFSEIEKTRATK